MDTERDVQNRVGKENALCSGRAAQGTRRGCKKAKGKISELLTKVTSY